MRTLKIRVTEFWNWFSSINEDFLAEIEAKRCSDLQPATSAAVNRLLPDFAWVQPMKEVPIKRGRPSGTGIHFFAKGNEGRRIFL